ncbi:unnamed protein product [Effrenium voratum]|uniref:PDZ domain-containing protein n=1 Tax=Effrenium voratum TaxID=2562239 RepID=A0AA36N672_9DINO|nr:unnamed protein product [Effrenium voratum]
MEGAQGEQAAAFVAELCGLPQYAATAERNLSLQALQALKSQGFLSKGLSRAGICDWQHQKRIGAELQSLEDSGKSLEGLTLRRSASEAYVRTNPTRPVPKAQPRPVLVCRGDMSKIRKPQGLLRDDESQISRGRAKAMNFIASTLSGTHIYQVEDAFQPSLVRTLPRAVPGGLAVCGRILGALLPSGTLCLWEDPAAPGKAEQFAWPCEVTPVARFYFSPVGSFLVTWEHTALKVEKGASTLKIGTRGRGKGNGKMAFGRAENLSVWALARRRHGLDEIEVTLEKEPPDVRLMINVDHLDGQSGLLLRRVDQGGLVYQHNVKVAESGAGDLLLPGDRILAVNHVTLSARSLSEEIGAAKSLRLRVRKGPGRLFARPLARFFAPHIAPGRWPPIQWTQDERFALRFVKDEVLVLDRALAVVNKIPVSLVSQVQVSSWGTAFATFSPAASSCAPAMVRVFSDAASSAASARPALTKGLFCDAAWVTMKWEPSEGKDLVVLVHASEVTEEDLAFRTLHGHGGNGLYLLRASEKEPVTALSTSEEVLLDVQWVPPGSGAGGSKRLLILQGPQPALAAMVWYTCNKAIQRVDLDRFGVRNAISCDVHGRSFCIHVQSERGMGLSNEADSADIFDLQPELGEGDAVAHRAAVVGHAQAHAHVGPSVSSMAFSPDGRLLLANVQVDGNASELRLLSAADGTVGCAVRFEGTVGQALWADFSGPFSAPEFPKPTNPRRAGASRELRVELRDRETLRKGAGRGGYGAAEALSAPEEHLLFEIETGAQSSRAFAAKAPEQSCRDFALRFCQQHRLAPSLAPPLAERVERLQHQALAAWKAQEAQQAKARKAKPKAKAEVDRSDPEALKKRLRGLQKKLREIDKLKTQESLDVLQVEKIATEREVLAEVEALETQLSLLRPVVATFDVDLGDGGGTICIREGDDCEELARRFCEEHGLEESAELAAHMRARLNA